MIQLDRAATAELLDRCHAATTSAPMARPSTSRERTGTQALALFVEQLVELAVRAVE